MSESSDQPKSCGLATRSHKEEDQAGSIVGSSAKTAGNCWAEYSLQGSTRQQVTSVVAQPRAITLLLFARVPNR